VVPRTDDAAADELLAPLRESPASAAILTDVDGTIAPIAPRPDEVAVLPEAKRLLTELSGRYGLVACVSGRRAAEARELVAVDAIAYIGNHGFERLMPGEDAPSSDPALDGHEKDAAEFAANWDPAELAELGLRREDKGVIQAIHWRGSRDENAAEARAHEIAADAEWRGLRAGWGRKVLEIRPPVHVSKGDAIAHLVEPTGIRGALYGGDDRTDLDGFAAPRRLREEDELAAAVCVGVASAEGPPELAASADLTVDGPEGFTELLGRLLP
jgi:trehalose-phosphatase